jgi:HAD superfamily hydrolase (TIGR01549 family)
MSDAEFRRKKAPEPQRRISYVIFDLDGTLVENLELIVRALNYAVKEFSGKKFSRAEVYPLFGPTLEQIVRELVPETKSEVAVQRYHAYYRDHFQELGRVYNGIPDLINRLQDMKLGIAICTGSDARMTKSTLELSLLQDIFQIVVTADNVKRAKPDPEGLVRALDLMHGHAKQAVYLGDSVRDIEASKRAGIGSAAALWGFGNPTDLVNSRPDFAFRDPSDALRQLTCN